MNKSVDNISSLRKKIKEIKQRIYALQERKAWFSWEDVEQEPKAQSFKLSIIDGMLTAENYEEEYAEIHNYLRREQVVELWKMRFDQEIERLIGEIAKLNTRIKFKQKKTLSPDHITDEDVITAKHIPIDTLISFNSLGKAHCIWHTEKSASMQYYTENNTVYCFGCHKSGDAIDVFSTLHGGISFLQAVRAMLSK